MKKTIAAFIALLTAYHIVYSQALDTLNTKEYPYSRYDSYIAATYRSSDSGLIIITNSDANHHKNSIFKLDNNLQVKWQKQYGDTAFSYVNHTSGVFETTKGEYIVFDNMSLPQNVIDTAVWFLTIFTAEGKEYTPVIFPKQWIRASKKVDNSIYGIVNKGYHGYNYSTFITEFNDQGTILREIQPELTDSVVLYDFLPLHNGFICFGYHCRAPLPHKSILVLYRHDLNGRIVWKKIYGDYTTYLTPQKIAWADDSSIIVVATQIDRIAENGTIDGEKVNVLKYSLNGDLLLDNPEGFFNLNGYVDFTCNQLSGNKAIVLGGNVFEDHYQFYHIIIPYDSSGTPLHSSRYWFNTYNEPVFMQFDAQRIIGVTTRTNRRPLEPFNDSDKVCIMTMGWNYPPYFLTKQNQITDEILEDVTYLATVVAADSFPGDQIAYSLVESIPPGMSINCDSGIVSWTPLDENDSGMHAITIVATDRVGQSDTLRFTIHVTPQNDSPVIDSIEIIKRADSLGDTVSLRVYARDEELDTLSYSWKKNSVLASNLNSILSYCKTDSLIDTITVTISDNKHQTSKTIFFSPFQSTSIHRPDNQRQSGITISRKNICFVFPDNVYKNATYHLSIVDLQGVLIKRIPIVHRGIERLNYNLETGSLPNGMYVIVVAGPEIEVCKPLYITH